MRTSSGIHGLGTAGNTCLISCTVNIIVHDWINSTAKWVVVCDCVAIVSIVSQLITDHLSAVITPVVSAYCTPLLVVTHFYSPFTATIIIPADQSDSSICTWSTNYMKTQLYTYSAFVISISTTIYTAPPASRVTKFFNHENYPLYDTQCNLNKLYTETPAIIIAIHYNNHNRTYWYCWSPDYYTPAYLLNNSTHGSWIRYKG